MPCDDCESNAKLRTSMICPDPWMNGANKDASSSGRKKNENKLLTTKARYTPYGGGKAGGQALGIDQKCTICRKQLAAGGKYCGECAHRKGVCYICGKQILDVAFYSGHGDLEKKPSKKDILAAKPTVTVTKKKNEDKDDLDFAEMQAARAKEQADKKAKSNTAAAAEVAAEAAERHETEENSAKQQGAAQQEQAAAAGQQQHASEATQAQQQTAAAAAFTEPTQLRKAQDWVELQSGGSVYYYNQATQQTQWEAPADFGAAAPPPPEMTGGWEERTAPDGRQYYFHAGGNLTTWKKPATFKL